MGGIESEAKGILLSQHQPRWFGGKSQGRMLRVWESLDSINENESKAHPMAAGGRR